jgi:hypothetical protein
MQLSVAPSRPQLPITLRSVFHVELRQRPHMARAFNLSEQEVTGRFLAPLMAGRPLIYEDREWDPRKVRLTVIEGPELSMGEMGMGRGWANAERSGSDVTERLMGRLVTQAPRPEALDRLKERIAGRLDAGPLTLHRVVAMAGELMDGRRASERLAVAEQAVWELLHEHASVLHEHASVLHGTGGPAGPPISQSDWQPQLMRWEAWSEPGVSLRRPEAG